MPDWQPATSSARVFSPNRSLDRLAVCLAVFIRLSKPFRTATVQIGKTKSLWALMADWGVAYLYRIAVVAGCPSGRRTGACRRARGPEGGGEWYTGSSAVRSCVSSLASCILSLALGVLYLINSWGEVCPGVAQLWFYVYLRLGCRPHSLCNPC